MRRLAELYQESTLFQLARGRDGAVADEAISLIRYQKTLSGLVFDSCITSERRSRVLDRLTQKDLLMDLLRSNCKDYKQKDVVLQILDKLHDTDSLAQLACDPQLADFLRSAAFARVADNRKKLYQLAVDGCELAVEQLDHEELIRLVREMILENRVGNPIISRDLARTMEHYVSVKPETSRQRTPGLGTL